MRSRRSWLAERDHSDVPSGLTRMDVPSPSGSADCDDRVARMNKAARTVVGVTVIVLGFLALLTPFTPGSWLIPIGLEFLGLRILLEDKLWQWTTTQPGSRVRRAIRRVLCLRRREALGRARRRREKGGAP